MQRHPAIGFVLACVFLDALGIGLIIPVLPRLIGSLAGNADAQTLWYGAIMISYGLMQFFFAPILGALSDRIGRRPVLLTGILGLALMMTVPALSSSLIAILLSRLVGGMMSSNIVVAQAYIADVTTENSRISSFGKIGAIFGIAFVLGPALGGVLGQYDPRLPFMVAGAICALNFLYGLFILPESLKEKNTSPLRWQRLNPFHAILNLTRLEGIRPFIVIITLFTLAQSLMQCTWALYVEYRYAWTPLMIGLSIFALGISISLTQGFFLPYLTKRLPPYKIVRLGLTIGVLAMFAIGFSPWGYVSLLLICLFALMGVVGPTIQGEISRSCTTTEQGVTMGAVSSLNSFTGAISPMIGTPLLMVTSRHTDNIFLAGTPYYTCAMLLILALAIALASSRDQENGRP